MASCTGSVFLIRSTYGPAEHRHPTHLPTPTWREAVREMKPTTAGERHGGFLVFRDEEGIRHAVRLTAVLAASDADASRDATIVQLPGNRFVAVSMSLDDFLGWVQGGAVHCA